MKVLVMGAGTVGSVYGGLTAKAGHEVLLVTGREHAEAVTDEGLRLVDISTGHTEIVDVEAVTEPPEQETYDLVLITVRNDQLRRAAEDLRPVLKGETYAMLFQNGLDGPQVLADIVGPERVTMGFGQVGGSKRPGVVHYYIAEGEHTVIGELDGEETARMRRAKALFDSAGFSTRIIPNIENWVVSHTAIVLPMTLVMLNKGPEWASFGESPEDLRLAVKGMKECVRVLRAHKIDLTREGSLIRLLPERVVAKLLEGKVVRGLPPEVRRHIWKHGVEGASEWRRIQEQILRMAEERDVPVETMSKL